MESLVGTRRGFVSGTLQDLPTLAVLGFLTKDEAAKTLPPYALHPAQRQYVVLPPRYHRQCPQVKSLAVPAASHRPTREKSRHDATSGAAEGKGFVRQ